MSTGMSTGTYMNIGTRMVMGIPMTIRRTMRRPTATRIATLHERPPR